MIKVKAVIGDEARSENNWIELLPVRSLETAETDIIEIVKELNSTTRKGEKRRVFIKLVENTNPIKLHNWDKITLMCVEGTRGDSVNIYQCKDCKLVVEVNALQHPATTEEDICHPELVCEKSNKLFKTKKGRLRHKCEKEDTYRNILLGKLTSKRVREKLKGTG